MEEHNSTTVSASYNESGSADFEAGNQQQERRIPPANSKGEETSDQPPPLIVNYSPTEYPRTVTGLPQIVEVGELSYQEFTIKIFTEEKSLNNNKSRLFFFEPIVVMDSNSVVILQPQELFEENVVCFTIQMWNSEIRLKVLELLRLDHPEIKEKNVRVMPYDNVRLVGKPERIHQSIRIMEEATSYRRLNEKLNFFLLCDLPSTAKVLAENLRSYPEFVVRKWQLEVECSGLNFNFSMMTDNTSMRRLFKFIVSTFPVDDVCTAKDTIENPPIVNAIEYEKDIKDLQAQIQELSNRTKSNETAVAVFSVVECSNATALTKNQSLSFSSFEFETKTEYGDFDLETGVFTVNKSGIFQFNFTGLAHITKSSPTHQFFLMVDGKKKSLSFVNNVALSDGFQPVALSALLQLVADQTVSIVLHTGVLYDSQKSSVTRYSCVCFT